jgi:putative hydrolase
MGRIVRRRAVDAPGADRYHGDMRIAIDTHTHSVASGHAYSTVEELARAARRKGLYGFVLTDHGPALEGGTHRYHFSNMRVLPLKLHGVRLYRGVEANILDISGKVDLDPYYLEKLDFVMAGLHEICLEPGTEEENTRTLEAVLANPYVDAVSHPGNPMFPVDFRRVVAAAKANGKALELNASSLRIRKGSDERCLAIARLCAEAGARVVCGSDAHWSGDVGRLEGALALVKSAGIPAVLVVNSSRASFERFIEERTARLEAIKA